MPRILAKNVAGAVKSDLAVNSVNFEQFITVLASKSRALADKLARVETSTVANGQTFNGATLETIKQSLEDAGSHENPSVMRLMRETSIHSASETTSVHQEVFRPLMNVQRDRVYQLKKLFKDKSQANFVVLMNDLVPNKVLLVDMQLRLKENQIHFEFGKMSREKMLEEDPDLSTSNYASYKGIAHVTEEYLYCIGTCPLKECETYAPLYLIVDARNIGREVGFMGSITSSIDRNKHVYSTKIIVGQVPSFDNVTLGSVDATEAEKSTTVWLKKGYLKTSPGGDNPPKGMTTMLKRLGCTAT